MRATPKLELYGTLIVAVLVAMIRELLAVRYVGAVNAEEVATCAEGKPVSASSRSVPRESCRCCDNIVVARLRGLARGDWEVCLPMLGG